MKYLGLWSPGLQNFFRKICKPPTSPPTYLMYAPLGSEGLAMNYLQTDKSDKTSKDFLHYL